MKVYHIIPSNKVCSPNIIALNLAEGLHSTGIEVVILYLKENEGATIVSENIKIQRLRYRDFFNLTDADIIHSHLLKADILNAILARIFKVKTISTIHSNIKYDLNSYVNTKIVAWMIIKLWYFALNMLDYRVAVSQSLSKSYAGLLKDCLAITNGIATPFSIDGDRIRNINPDNIRVGIVSRLHIDKGIEDAFSLAEKHNDISLIVYGDGVFREECKIKHESLPNFIYKGYTDNISNAFASFDIFLMPSRHEGFGMTILESLSYNVPVVCYDIPVFREILGEGDFYYRTLDELSQKIHNITLNYDSVKKKQVQRLQYFQLSNMIEKYSDLYYHITKIN